MSLAREQRTRTRRRLLPAAMLAGAVALVSKPAFLPAPSTRTSVSEMNGQRQAAVAAAAALSTLGATALPAFAADPLAHGTVGTMDMSTFQGIFERGAFGGLLASTVMAWWRATLGGARAAGDEGKPASFWALLFSCISIAVLLSGRWYESGHFPLSNMYESLMFLAWGVTSVTIYFLSSAYGAQENNKTGEPKNTAMSDVAAVMASPLSLGIVAFATLKLPKELQKASSLVPALQSDWLVMHVSVVMMAYATLMFGSVLCMAVLALSQPKDSPITALRESVLPFIRGIADGLGSPRLQPAMATSPQVPQGTVAAMTLAPESNVQNTSGPAIMSTSGGAITMEFSSSGGAPVQLSEEDSLALTLDDLAYRSLLLGFGFLTVGIVSGAVWANEAWGNYWSWDPKETWALICWLVYAGYLHTRLQLGWDTRDSSKIGAFGFFVVWLCYIGVNLMGVGLHSYGFFLK